VSPRIGYLVAEIAGWDNERSWKFYTEEEVPDYMLRNSNFEVRRLVYWEIEPSL
jgi:hypothetical protein